MMRRTPMKRGTKPMARGQPLKAKAPMKRRYKPADGRENREYAMACYGEPCYLRLVPCAHKDTVVPCHANWGIYGKGGALKANDLYTVPGCLHCHHDLDQGKRLTKSERQAAWEAAYERWKPARMTKMSGDADGSPR